MFLQHTYFSTLWFFLFIFKLLKIVYWNVFNLIYWVLKNLYFIYVFQKLVWLCFAIWLSKQVLCMHSCQVMLFWPQYNTSMFDVFDRGRRPWRPARSLCPVRGTTWCCSTFTGPTKPSRETGYVKLLFQLLIPPRKFSCFKASSTSQYSKTRLMNWRF